MEHPVSNHGFRIKGGEMIEQLTYQILKVSDLRQKARVATDAKTASRLEWECQNKELIDNAIETAQQVEEEETKLRELTLEAYAQTGNKAPAPGVGVREVTKLDYDKAVAFNWAAEHVLALKLDTTAFEKIAKASPLDFVRIYQEPQATIATQLEVVE